MYNIWLNTTEWRSPYQANVHGVGTMTLPSGSDVQGSVAGRMFLHEAWKDARITELDRLGGAAGVRVLVVLRP